MCTGNISHGTRVCVVSYQCPPGAGAPVWVLLTHVVYVLPMAPVEACPGLRLWVWVRCSPHTGLLDTEARLRDWSPSLRAAFLWTAAVVWLLKACHVLFQTSDVASQVWPVVFHSTCACVGPLPWRRDHISWLFGSRCPQRGCGKHPLTRLSVCVCVCVWVRTRHSRRGAAGASVVHQGGGSLRTTGSVSGRETLRGRGEAPGLALG